jgi:hypothetical protein
MINNVAMRQGLLQELIFSSQRFLHIYEPKIDAVKFNKLWHNLGRKLRKSNDLRTWNKGIFTTVQQIERSSDISNVQSIFIFQSLK